jgi:hypothetical protein
MRNSVTERAGFDRKIKAFEIGEARDASPCCLAGQHDRQSGKVIRRGRRQCAERHPPAPIGRTRTGEVGQPRGLEARLA